MRDKVKTYGFLPKITDLRKNKPYVKQFYKNNGLK